MKKEQDLSKMTTLISRLIDIQECATGKRFPFWEMEERPRLMSEEIDELINDLQEDENLVIS